MEKFYNQEADIPFLTESLKMLFNDGLDDDSLEDMLVKDLSEIPEADGGEITVTVTVTPNHFTVQVCLLINYSTYPIYVYNGTCDSTSIDFFGSI